MGHLMTSSLELSGFKKNVLSLNKDLTGPMTSPRAKLLTFSPNKHNPHLTTSSSVSSYVSSFSLTQGNSSRRLTKPY